jgi:prophage regulatory protein
MATYILRRPAVSTRTGLSRSSIYSMMSKDQFPRPIQLGGKAVGWREQDIEDWLAARPTSASAATYTVKRRDESHR